VIPFNLGNVLDELGRSHEAEIAYRQALARDPAMADAWYNLGVTLETAGKWEDAVLPTSKRTHHLVTAGETRSRSALANGAAIVRNSLDMPLPAMSPPRSSRWSFTPLAPQQPLLCVW
jgi:Flp pilus assembly protein TadD